MSTGDGEMTTNFHRLAALTSVVIAVVILFMLFAKSTNVVILPTPKATAGIYTRPLVIGASKNDSIMKEGIQRLDLTPSTIQLQSTTVIPTAETESSEQTKCKFYIIYIR